MYIRFTFANKCIKLYMTESAYRLQFYCCPMMSIYLHYIIAAFLSSVKIISHIHMRLYTSNYKSQKKDTRIKCLNDDGYSAKRKLENFVLCTKRLWKPMKS